MYCDESFGTDLDDTAGTSDFGQPRSRDAGIPDCKKVNVSLVRAIAEAACGGWETRTARWNPRLRRGNRPGRPWRSRSASNREQRYRARQTAPAVSPRRGRSGLRDCGNEKGQSGKTVNSHERGSTQCLRLGKPETRTVRRDRAGELHLVVMYHRQNAVHVPARVDHETLLRDVVAHHVDEVFHLRRGGEYLSLYRIAHRRLWKRDVASR